MAYINGKEILFSAVISGGGEQPTLNAPSVALDLYTAALTITDEQNGNFASGYKIYLAEKFLATVTEKTVLLLERTEYTEDVTVKVCAAGENFKDSEFSEVLWEKPKLYAPTVSIDNITDTITITDTNGTKTKEFAIYANDILLCTTTETSVVLSAYMELTETQFITVKAISNESYYLDSAPSEFAIWAVKTAGTPGLAYELSSDGLYYTCTGIGTATETDIIIGSIKDGLPVKEVGYAAFNSNSNITSVTIPHGVERLLQSSFSSCSALKNVYISESVNRIRDYAFANSAVEYLEYNAIEATIEMNKIPFFKTEGISKPNMSVKIGANVKVIPCLFGGNPSATSARVVSLEFEEGSVLEIISNHAFYGAYNNSEKIIIFPKTLKAIYSLAFGGCSMGVLDFSNFESIPIISTNAFGTVAQILVPSALYDEWITAENWSAYADKIVAV